jgi:hypothetical protein
MTETAMMANNLLAAVLHFGYQASMRTYVLVALGCGFWLLQLAPLLTLTLLHGTPENGFGFHYEGFGFSYELLLLFAIPLLMLALTMVLGWLAMRGKLAGTMIAASSVLAVFAAFSWCVMFFQMQTS